ncbi:MAG TPA: polysaccharide biosynthesis/export family protein [Allosphingosinicella sp.]|nr:polysaccharide biosynthesis/export family protein [Allosphingosinicella sp.]
MLLGGLSAAACSSPQLIDTGRVGIVSAANLPAPTLEDLSRGARVHLVGPFDRVAVEVFGLPELSRQVQVDASGHIALPLAGRIEVTGKTPEELGQLIAERLRGGYVRDPSVTVTVLETVSQLVTVDGEVRQPGLYPVAGPMTLMRAIARAQGTTDYASVTHVVLFRTVGGRQMAALYDVRAIRLGAYEDPPIYPDDVVVVGESQARRLFPQILSAAGLLVAPLITTLNKN